MKTKWNETSFKLSNGVILKVYHNLPRTHGQSIQEAFENWMARTEIYTEKSFCSYINSKRLRGLTDHVAYTEKEYLELVKEEKC